VTRAWSCISRAVSGVLASPQTPSRASKVRAVCWPRQPRAEDAAGEYVGGERGPGPAGYRPAVVDVGDLGHQRRFERVRYQRTTGRSRRSIDCGPARNGMARDSNTSAVFDSHRGSATPGAASSKRFAVLRGWLRSRSAGRSVNSWFARAPGRASGGRTTRCGPNRCRCWARGRVPAGPPASGGGQDDTSRRGPIRLAAVRGGAPWGGAFSASRHPRRRPFEHPNANGQPEWRPVYGPPSGLQWRDEANDQRDGSVVRGRGRPLRSGTSRGNQRQDPS
jgi:hypothetical protein